MTELRVTEASGGTSTSAGRRFFGLDQSQVDAQTAPPNTTTAMSPPMTILFHDPCMAIIPCESQTNFS
jgi:hypothetical protein